MNTHLEQLIRRDRTLVTIALILVALMAWLWLLAGAGMGIDAFEMTRHSQMSMPATGSVQWTASHTLIMFFMWWIMMIAMMLPSAAPVILLATALNRRSKSESPPYGPTSAFVTGYLSCWAVFSAVALLLQWALQQAGWINDMLVSVNSTVSGLLLLLAGGWQFLPWKQACLRHCRSPVTWLTDRRSPGFAVAFRLGVHHGAYCLGCCWFLMALLFVGGVMNLYWIIGLTIYVWIEKVLPGGPLVSRIMGGVLMGFGLRYFIV